MTLPEDTSPQPSGFGGLLTTEVEHVDLGTHGGRELRARVERRAARIALGRRTHVSLILGRLRPVAIEVTEGDRRYDMEIPRPSRPWRRTAERVLLVWLASLAVTRLARRLRSRR